MKDSFLSHKEIRSGTLCFLFLLKFHQFYLLLLQSLTLLTNSGYKFPSDSQRMLSFVIFNHCKL